MSKMIDKTMKNIVRTIGLSMLLVIGGLGEIGPIIGVT